MVLCDCRTRAAGAGRRCGSQYRSRRWFRTVPDRRQHQQTRHESYRRDEGGSLNVEKEAAVTNARAPAHEATPARPRLSVNSGPGSPWGTIIGLEHMGVFSIYSNRGKGFRRPKRELGARYESGYTRLLSRLDMRARRMNRTVSARAISRLGESLRRGWQGCERSAPGNSTLCDCSS